MNTKEPATAHSFPNMSERVWLQKNRHYPLIDETKMQSIFYFGLIWNLFERECCENFATITIHPRELADVFTESLPLELITPIFEYFKDRYIHNDKPNTIFKNFRFGPNGNSGAEYKGFVQDALMDDPFHKRRAVQALLYIAFRLRNNLFHGEKEINTLYQQNESFKHINRLLMAIIQLKQCVK
ncbi:MAG: hypothetical protein PHS63_04515 [Desulfoplanes sp.]|nr:hypothetical protein [Desulfoplanes sp.]